MTVEQRLGAALVCLEEVAAFLQQEGLARQGEYEGLFAYAALNRLVGQANVAGLPLSEIGLGKFDPDSLLATKSKNTA